MREKAKKDYIAKKAAGAKTAAEAKKAADAKKAAAESELEAMWKKDPDTGLKWSLKKAADNKKRHLRKAEKRIKAAYLKEREADVDVAKANRMKGW